MGIKFQAIHLPLPVGLLGGSSFAALRSAELLIGCPICSLLLIDLEKICNLVCQTQ